MRNQSVIEEYNYADFILDEVSVLAAYVGKDERYRFVNRQYEEWLHVDRSTFIGRHVREVLGNDAYLAIKPYIDSVLSGKRVRFEMRVPYKSGTRDIEATYIPHFDRAGNVLGFSSLVIDITERLRLRDLAHATKDILYRTVLDAIPRHFIWIVGPDGELIYFSKSWLDVLGVSREEATEENLQKHFIPEEREERMAQWEKAIREDVIFHQRYRYRVKDGSYRHFEDFGGVIWDENGKKLGWVGITSDIEDFIRSEETLSRATRMAEEASRAKSNFLAHISHEIRTPLTAIYGNSELLQNPKLSHEEMNEYLESIYRNSEHLLVIVNDLLDLAKIDAGKMDASLSEIDLPSELQLALVTFKPQALAKGISLDVFAESPVPKGIYTDRNFFRQILGNLIGNAVKFTESGGIHIVVSYRDDQLRIHVIDSGIGIAEAKQSELFEAFMQVDDSETRRFGGTGLGLALSRKLARLVGGEVLLYKSTEGEGSDFLLTLPVRKTEGGELVSASQLLISEKRKQESVGEKPLNDLSILLVEDSPDLILLFTRMLRNLGANVTSAKQGDEGVRLALEREFDVILMDIQMPVMGGHQAVQLIKKAGSKVPVIALTAHSSLIEQERCKQSGFDGYIAKPVNIQKLAAEIKALVSDHPNK